MTRVEYETLLPIIKEIEERAHQDPHTNYPDIVAAAQIIKELRNDLCAERLNYLTLLAQSQGDFE
jgi:hypothetical protein